VLIYAVLVIGFTISAWLTWRASRLGPLAAYTTGGVISWGISGLLYFLATRAVIGDLTNLVNYVWIPVFTGYAFFIFLLGSLPKPRSFPVWLYALMIVPISAFLLAQPYTTTKSQLNVLFILQLLLIYYALPLWYALARNEAPEGRALWVPVLIFFGSGITIWFALTPSYNDTALILATISWLLWLWLLVEGLELEIGGRSVSLTHLTGVAVGFLTLWMLPLNQWCLSGISPSNLQLKLWMTSIASLIGGLSIFLPLYLFKRRSERKLARWGSILSGLATFLWKHDDPSPESIAKEIFRLFRRGCDNVAGVRLAIFDDLLVGEKTTHGLTLQDRNLVLGRVYLHDKNLCDGLLTAILPLASKRLGEVVHSFNWRSQAQTDPLTELLNRRGFDVNLHYSVDRAASKKIPVTVAMLDIDHFKQVNDRFGHAAGDKLLQQVAEVLRRNLREGDLAVRWGGEEFLVLLTKSNLDQAEQVFERIRKRIRQLTIADAKEPVTVSVGLAGGYTPDDPRQVYEWIKLADTALRRAKDNGRNRIEKS